VVLIEAIDFIYDAVRLDEKLLIREFNNLNVNYRLVNAGELTLNLPNGGDGGAAFIRTISQHKSQLVSQLYEALGGISINPAMSILIGNNKAVTLWFPRFTPSDSGSSGGWGDYTWWFTHPHRNRGPARGLNKPG